MKSPEWSFGSELPQDLQPEQNDLEIDEKEQEQEALDISRVNKLKNYDAAWEEIDGIGEMWEEVESDFNDRVNTYVIKEGLGISFLLAKEEKSRELSKQDSAVLRLYKMQRALAPEIDKWKQDMEAMVQSSQGKIEEEISQDLQSGNFDPEKIKEKIRVAMKEMIDACERKTEEEYPKIAEFRKESKQVMSEWPELIEESRAKENEDSGEKK